MNPMKRRKTNQLEFLVASDSDSDDTDALPRAREETVLHRGLRTDEQGQTRLVVTRVPKRPPEWDLLQPDNDSFAPTEPGWDSTLEVALPFAEEDWFAFDEGHPVDTGRRKEQDSVMRDRPMAQWRDRRAVFLDELLRTEGRRYHRQQTRCATCATDVAKAIFRCRDCFTDALFCKACLVSIHRDNPLHRVECWGDGAFFETIDLKSLGLRIQLGHGHNGTCPGTLAKRARAGQQVWRTRRVRGTTSVSSTSNGIHEVGLDFCCCGLAEDHDVQLLRARLYPATTTNPVTAATFRVLRDFHLLSLEAKCSAHHFYNKLARQTNNNGVFQPRTRYNEFLRMTRQWRHLQMLKRAGRGHAANGIPGTRPGECALLCPACPQPGKNLPADGSWRTALRERRFLYALFLALNANFRMKRKDKSTCVAHDAVDEPERDAYGTAASGIGTVDCARHNMKRPNGVGDLQKGERYINMDYMLWKSLENHDDIVQLFISYDIVCQWYKNIWRRLASYHPKLCERGGRRFYVWLIPKFHLPAHIEACNIRFSFNLTPFVGQTDGEAPERGWANANPLANSTKEMGPGARRDALNDHFNDWNHKKIVGLGEFLLERAKKLPAQAGKTQEMKNPNPFKVDEKHEGLFAIRGRLAAEASTAVAGDAADDVRGDLHAYEMVDMGMQLEDQQRELAFDAAAVKLHATDRQKTTLLERSNKLGRKITEWLKIRESFTPMVARLRMEDDQARVVAARLQPTPALPVHAVKLWLPSRLAGTPTADVKMSHARYEFALRVGQAHAALAELRRLLLVRTAKYKYKDEFQHGVAAITRGKTSIAQVDERIRRIAAQYRAARAALISLGPVLNETDWKLQLHVLAPDDVRQRPRATFSDPKHKSRLKRKRGETLAHAAAERRKKKDEERQASWIWRSALTAEEGSEPGMAEALHIEWAKTRARAWRWTEEVDLVEEMRRVLAFLNWKANHWTSLMMSATSRTRSYGRGSRLMRSARRGCSAICALVLKGTGSIFRGTFRRSGPGWGQFRRRGEGVENEDVDESDESDEDAPIALIARDERLVASESALGAVAGDGKQSFPDPEVLVSSYNIALCVDTVDHVLLNACSPCALWPASPELHRLLAGIIYKRQTSKQRSLYITPPATGGVGTRFPAARGPAGVHTGLCLSHRLYWPYCIPCGKRTEDESGMRPGVALGRRRRRLGPSRCLTSHEVHLTPISYPTYNDSLAFTLILGEVEFQVPDLQSEFGKRAGLIMSLDPHASTQLHPLTL
ncbi:hypothetical protein B0H14DRAFT_3567333 [Mycena olivaceomarginata]|nr:hypothetical protein B0H14DRAFT_3567333 [Mycena olivaceomarginata]